MDIYPLLKFGKLDGVFIGARLPEVVASLNRLIPAALITEQDMNGVLVLSSELIELHFVNGALVNVIVKMSSCWGNKCLTIGSAKRKLTRRSSLEKTIALLFDAGIEWKFFQRYCNENRVELITEGSASLEFLSDAGKVTINRIHLTEGEIYEKANEI